MTLMRSPRRPAAAVGADLAIAKVIADTYDDPLAFVMLAYPWASGASSPAFPDPTVGNASF